MSEDLISQIKQKLENYRPPPHAVGVLKEAKLVLLIGTTAAGRNSIIKNLLKSGEYYFVISHTTRPPRENNGVLEVDGEDYYFIDNQKLLTMLKNQEFVECKYIHKQQFSGITISELEKAIETGKVAITDVDTQGAEAFLKQNPNICCIYVLPPDFETWIERIASRHSHESPSEILRRLNSAKQELQAAIDTQNYLFVINDDLEIATKAVAGLIKHPQPSPVTQKEGVTIAQELLKQIEIYTKN